MWLEICMTIVAFSQIMNVMVALAKYYKDYLEIEEEEEMTEDAKRMFS
jgi:hypothetical protein